MSLWYTLDYFELMLGSPWITLGSLWVTLDLLWDTLGSPWGDFGVTLGRLLAYEGNFGSLWGDGTPLGDFGRL